MLYAAQQAENSLVLQSKRHKKSKKQNKSMNNK